MATIIHDQGRLQEFFQGGARKKKNIYIYAQTLGLD